MSKSISKKVRQKTTAKIAVTATMKTTKKSMNKTTKKVVGTKIKIAGSKGSSSRVGGLKVSTGAKGRGKPRLDKTRKGSQIGVDGIKALIDVVKENLWWTWQTEVSQIFQSVDGDLWARMRQNPWEFLTRVKAKKLEVLNSNPEINRQVLQLKANYDRVIKSKKSPKIAYFCMEFGISHLLKNYSGGLGILAGDHLKSASDLNLPLCAFGFAYRYGYFHQKISPQGAQESRKVANDFSKPPFWSLMARNGKPIKITIPAPRRTITFQVWKVMVGTVDLYLLDTDVPENSNQDRKISDQLYSGDQAHRLIQEYTLAVGGYRLAKALRLPIQTFHMNEGHTAMLSLTRLSDYMKTEKLTYEKAMKKVRSSMVFTTHTPIPAGHDVFPQDMVTPYLELFSSTVGLDRCRDLAADMTNTLTEFSMTGLAARSSRFINGVSQIHAEVTRDMFKGMNVGPIEGITNGVHAPSWISPELQSLFQKELGPKWLSQQLKPEFWTRIYQIDDGKIWSAHQTAKEKLLTYLRQHVETTWAQRGESQDLIQKSLSNLTDKTFIATFARRFATYKRAHLLFSQPERFARILSGPQPVVFLFAGKAHPRDSSGQALIEKIVQYSRQPEFAGKILFVENYEIDVAKLLVSGSDIWVNNPLRPLEASGTSGMKAAMNGCLNFSVPDGWWAEGYNEQNGWEIGTKEMTGSQEHQDAQDGDLIYNLLEKQIVPLFAQHNGEGLPEKWIQMMKNSMATLIPVFNTDRMVKEYAKKFY